MFQLVKDVTQEKTQVEGDLVCPRCGNTLHHRRGHKVIRDPKNVTTIIRDWFCGVCLKKFWVVIKTDVPKPLVLGDKWKEQSRQKGR